MIRFLLDAAAPRLQHAVEDGNGEGRWNTEELTRITRQAGFDGGPADAQVVCSDLYFAPLFENPDESCSKFIGDRRLGGLASVACLSRPFEGGQSLACLGERVLDCEEWIAAGCRLRVFSCWLGRPFEGVEHRNLRGRERRNRERAEQTCERNQERGGKESFRDPTGVLWDWSSAIHFAQRSRTVASSSAFSTYVGSFDAIPTELRNRCVFHRLNGFCHRTERKHGAMAGRSGRPARHERSFDGRLTARDRVGSIGAPEENPR